jgi:dTDP-4-amino-4,6-dideoxygalactose transaminase
MTEKRPPRNPDSSDSPFDNVPESSRADDRIPLSRPWLGEPEAEAVRKVLLSGWLMQGPTAERFEREVASYVGARHAVAVASGTAALHLTLVALDIGPGDEVIVPSHSFVATANTVVYVGATPVYVDIDPRTYNLDPELLESVVTEKTRAICVVHQSGLPCDMDRINAFAEKRGLLVYEDAACALGAQYKGRHIGTHSEAACFSFHPRKIITTGEGGMITTDSDELAARLRRLRQHGMARDARSRHDERKVMRVEFPVVGFNYRLTDVQSAIGVGQMKRLPIILESRKEVASLYGETLRDIAHIELPFVPDYATHTYQSYVVRVLPSSPVSRDDLIRHLASRDIAATPGIGCIHRQGPYKPFVRTSLPFSERASDETLLLPFFPQMTAAQIERIGDTIRHELGD